MATWNHGVCATCGCASVYTCGTVDIPAKNMMFQITRPTSNSFGQDSTCTTYPGADDKENYPLDWLGGGIWASSACAHEVNYSPGFCLDTGISGCFKRYGKARVFCLSPGGGGVSFVARGGYCSQAGCDAASYGSGQGMTLLSSSPIHYQFTDPGGQIYDFYDPDNPPPGF